jgi:CRP-like cAMP-binding protein
MNIFIDIGMPDSNPLINYLEAFGAINPDDKELIRSSFSLKSFKEGEDLCKTGEICREMNFICKGILKIFIPGEDGDEVIHFFLKENQFCSILHSFTNQVPAKGTIRAACDAEVITLPYDALMNVYQKLPYLKTRIDEIIQRSLLDKIDIRNSYLGQDATTRYKNFLVRQPDIALRVSLGDIASYLGVTQQSLSRIRKNIA